MADSPSATIVLNKKTPVDAEGDLTDPSPAPRHHSASAPQSPHSSHSDEDDKSNVLGVHVQPSQPASNSSSSQGEVTRPKAADNKTAPEGHDAGSTQLADKENTELRAMLDEVRGVFDGWIGRLQGVSDDLIRTRVVEFSDSYWRRPKSRAQPTIVHSVEQDTNPKDPGGVEAACADFPEQDVLVDLQKERADKSKARANPPATDNAGSPAQGTVEKIYVQRPTASSRQDQAVAASDSGSDNEGRKAKPVTKKNLKRFAVCNKADFEESLGKIGMKSMRVGGQNIDLSCLARQTVELAQNTHELRMKDYYKQLEDHQKAEKNHREQVKLNMQAGKYGCLEPGLPAKTVTEEESWQIMFNLIAYIFRPAQEHVPEIARVLSNPSARQSMAAACSNMDLHTERESKNTDIQDVDEGYILQEAATSDGKTSESIDEGKEKEIESQIIRHETELKGVTHGFKVWMSRVVKTPLTKVYNYYDQVQTVQRYDKILALSKGRETKHIFALVLAKRDINPNTQIGRGVSSPVLQYIASEICPAGETPLKTTVISERISHFRPVMELHRELGDGILALLGKNTRDLESSVPSAMDSEWKTYQKIGHIADCMVVVDKQIYAERLANMLSDVNELILQPALKLRVSGSIRPMECPSRKVLDELDIGARLDYTLTQMKGSLGADAGTDSAKRRGETRKRRRSSGETDNGVGQAKKGRHELDSADFSSEDDAESAGSSGDVDSAEAEEETSESERLQRSRSQPDDRRGQDERRGDRDNSLEWLNAEIIETTGSED